MPETISAVLERLNSQPGRFEQLKALLRDEGKRKEFLDCAEDLTRNISVRYNKKMLDHAKFYAELVEREGMKLAGHQHGEAVQVLEHEFKSILGAANRALEFDDDELLLVFAKYIVDYCRVTGRTGEGLPLYERMIEHATRSDNNEYKIQSLIGYGIVLFGVGRFADARQALSEAQILAHGEGDEDREAWAMSVLGNVTCMLGDYSAAIELQEASLEIRRRIGRPGSISSALHNLATTYHHLKNTDMAKSYYEECLAIDRDLGDLQGIAVTLNNLGIVARDQGDYETARNYYLESNALSREVGDRGSEGMSYCNLGWVEYRLGNLSEAEKLSHKALSIHQASGSAYGIAVNCGMLGYYALVQGNYSNAEEYFKESVAGYSETGLHHSRADKIAQLSLTYIHQGKLQLAFDSISEALGIEFEIDNPDPWSDSVMVAGIMLFELNNLTAASILLYGKQFQAIRENHNFGPLSRNHLDNYLSKLEAEISSAKLTKLKAQAEAMSLDELVEYALKALGELKLTEEVAAEA